MIDVLSQNDDGLVGLEAFTTRFARLTDILVQQVLRANGELESQDPLLRWTVSSARRGETGTPSRRK